MSGSYTSPEDDVDDANSVAELSADLAAPSEFVCDSIVCVEIPERTSIEYSTFDRNYGRSGGAAQTRLVDKVPEDYWTPLDSLSEVGS